jgi:hypothetical protein
MEKNTTHGGDAGELRCGYIFRYYINSCNQSESSAAFLDFEGMKNLIKDVLKLKSLQVEESKIEAELKLIYQNLSLNYRDKVEKKVFLRCVGNMQLRGTSGLFRSTVSPLQQLRLKRCYESNQLIEVQNQKKMLCKRHSKESYTIATHTVRLASDGTIVDSQDNKNQSDLAKIPLNLPKMSNT